MRWPFTRTPTTAQTARSHGSPGRKLDATCPTLTNNGNVPNKDDFTGLASYNELDSANPPNTFLYGAEIRATANGNSSGNVELNQSAGTASCPIERMAGDRLLAFDFTGGVPCSTSTP